MDDDRSPGESSDDSSAEARGDTMPLEELADRVRNREPGEGDPMDLPQPELEDDQLDPFEDRSVGSIDTGAIWESLDADEDRQEADFDREHVVSKQWYCERCEYFSEPPEVRCTHEGTVIVEFVKNDRVRVHNCPVVAERQALGEYPGTDTHSESP